MKKKIKSKESNIQIYTFFEKKNCIFNSNQTRIRIFYMLKFVLLSLYSCTSYKKYFIYSLF